MTEHVRQRGLLKVDRTVKAWSVSFKRNPLVPDGERKDLARGMVAEVAVGDAKVRNDFDSVSIFNRPIFNATWDESAHCWRDFVAMGEEGFTFSPTETNREVVYRCTPFWYRTEAEDGYGPTFVSVTDKPLPGYRLAPMFRDAYTYEYRPCFEMALGSDGKPHSRAGLVPYEARIDRVMDKVLSYGDGARSETMADWFSDYLLLLVEFGTRNLQGVMRGRCSERIYLEYFDDTMAGIPLKLYAYNPDDVTVGEKMLLAYHHMEEGEQKIEVEVLSVSDTPEEWGYPIDLGIDEILALTTEVVSAFVLLPLPAETGEVLPYVTAASSGMRSERSNAPCVWRGKENPWGNVASFVCDMMFRYLGSGAVEAYRLPDVGDYTGKLNEHYVKLDYVPKSKASRYYGFIREFALLGNEDCLVPATFDTEHSELGWATRMEMTLGSVGDVLFLRVGSDYTRESTVNHGTYEMLAAKEGVLCGARLILQEGV